MTDAAGRRRQRSTMRSTGCAPSSTSLDALPVADRVPRFQRANDVLARELALLDEV